MDEDFDFNALANAYDDTLMICTSGYLRQYVDPAQPRLCHDAVDVIDLTDESESTLHRMECAVCSEVVESSSDLYPIVTCDVCNHGVCMDCFDQVMTPLKAVTYYMRSSMDSWQTPLLRCPFCSSCVEEKRFFAAGVFYKTMQEASWCEPLLTHRLSMLTLVRLQLEEESF